MDAYSAEGQVRSHLTTIKLEAGLILRGDDPSSRVARRAHEIAAAVNRICAALEASSAELRRLASGLTPRAPS